MTKLYPPIISGTLPAFYLEENDMDRSIKITVPFTMNRAVSPVQVSGFALRMKTVQNSNYLYTALITDNTCFNMEGSPYVTFTLKTSNNTEERELILRTLKLGLFYKLQLAYIDNNNNIGNYSSVGISKFTTKPQIYIADLQSNITNTHIYNYTGVYDQSNGDSTEKVYTYRFDIYDEFDKLIATSGDKIHNVTDDTELNVSYDIFAYNRDFELYKPYKIQYSVVTANNLEISSPVYRIHQQVTINTELNANIVAKSNFDDGYVQVDLVGITDDTGIESIVTGSFILSRSCEDDDYMKWEKLLTFKIIAQFPSRHLWKDFTVQQGKNYKYSIQQYNDNNLYSQRLYSNIVFADFEDAFLYDGERQLKIRYNPKLGNIKTNIVENKIDTMGSKYPFFFKNSNINYKEFTISGLLSYLADNNFFFISKEELNIPEKSLVRNNTKSQHQISDPVSENIMRERLFKNKVLEWLNNGKPKLFRSPHEGNFIVRMMKTTLNPENKLGRLLHTFNGTAYEIADCTYENLIQNNFIKVIDNDDIQFLNWKTIELSQKDEYGEYKYCSNMVLNNQPTKSVEFLNMRPGQLINFKFEDSREETVMIGVTGCYKLESPIFINEIKVLNSNVLYQDGIQDIYLTGSMTYSYYISTNNYFSKVSKVSVSNVLSEQYIGQHDDILKELDHIYLNNQWIKNPKIELLKVYNIKCYKRPLENVSEKDGQLYLGNSNIKYDVSQSNLLSLAEIGSYTKIAQYSPQREEYRFNLNRYYDYYNSKVYDPEEYATKVYINNNEIDLKNVEYFMFDQPELDSLHNDNGTYVEISYQIKNIDFTIEDNDYYQVYNSKQTYLNAQYKLDKYFEIVSVLGDYQRSVDDVQDWKNTLVTQINADKEIAIAPYEAQKTQLNSNYNTISTDNETKHTQMVQYIEQKLKDFNKPNLTKEEKEQQYQYQQALYVENYEYAQTLERRKIEHEKKIDSINAQIEEISRSFIQEISYINEKAAAQLSTIAGKKESLLNEAAALFGPMAESQWADNDYLYVHLEMPLRDTLKSTYNNFIIALINSQEEEARKEG